MINENVIKQLKDYADINNVPIMLDDGMDFLLDYIKKNNVKRILEIGAAIGYSAIMMCTVGQDITVTTIERDEKRYLDAMEYFKNGADVKYFSRAYKLYRDDIIAEYVPIVLSLGLVAVGAAVVLKVVKKFKGKNPKIEDGEL